MMAGHQALKGPNGHYGNWLDTMQRRMYFKGFR